ncbi:MAG: amidohydrolase family protein [Bacteroidota bacterium]
MNKFLFYFLLLCVASASANNPAPKQSKSILLKGGILHVGNGVKIDNSVVGFKNGIITHVSSIAENKINEKDFDTIINIPNQHIYPGFIAPNNILGLQEIEAVRATNDFAETGEMNPNVRSIIAYNAESKIVETVKTNGVLLAQTTPRYGAIAGTSSVVQLDAWNWQDAVVLEDDGVHLNWPSFYTPTKWGMKGPEEFEKNKNYEKSIDELALFFKEATAYCANQNTEKNLRFEAMRSVINGSKNLYIRANEVKEITEAVRFAQEQKIKKIVLVGGKYSYLCTSILKENNIPVMVGRVHDLPERADDDIDLPFKLPYLLAKENILFCLQNEGDMEAMNARNLPFLAGTAVAFGLTYEQGVSAISLNAAKILGIDKKYGSVEIGKSATLFISNGDALDMKSNQLTFAFIDGRKVDLKNFQQKLYEKYQDKYKQQNN